MRITASLHSFIEAGAAAEVIVVSSAKLQSQPQQTTKIRENWRINQLLTAADVLSCGHQILFSRRQAHRKPIVSRINRQLQLQICIQPLLSSTFLCRVMKNVILLTLIQYSVSK